MHLRILYSAAFGWNVHNRSDISQSGLMCPLRLEFLLIFCLDDLSIDVCRALKSPAMYCC